MALPSHYGFRIAMFDTADIFAHNGKIDITATANQEVPVQGSGYGIDSKNPVAVETPITEPLKL